MSKIEVEVYVLSDMNTALRKLHESINEEIQRSERAIQSEMHRLQQVVLQRAQEVNRCQAALQQCHSQVDEEGNPLPCTAELQALQEAQRDLRAAQDQVKTFSDQADRFRHRARQIQQSTDKAISEGRAYLEKHIQASLRYLKNHPEALGSVPGAGKHKTLYNRARREWFRRGASEELRTEPRELQGWMRQEIRRGSYRSPYRGSGTNTTAYHTGHFVAGIDIPENFRWELSADNLRRPHAARRHNLGPTHY